jgi:hypothetical protein
VKIAPGAVVCSECELRGDITIGSMTVVHPRASIIAEAGPIIIGECNIVEEQAQIINRFEMDMLYVICLNPYYRGSQNFIPCTSLKMFHELPVPLHPNKFK